jgi:hypothetical protein
LAREQKPYWITLLPALFMTVVCSSFLFVSKNSFGLDMVVGYGIGGAALIVAVAWFYTWKSRNIK